MVWPTERAKRSSPSSDVIRTVSETGSTNADLLDAVRKGEVSAEGEWLVADRQSAGRGRQGRTWFDGTGNFMGSTVVHLRADDPSPATLSFVAGLAAYEAVKPFVPGNIDLMLKWPNDLLLAGAKVNGVLLERAENVIVVGIGVNLAAAPTLPDRKTAAIADHAPAPDRDLFAQTLAGAFSDELGRWRMYGLPPLLRRWESAAHPKGTSLSVQPPGEMCVKGCYDGIGKDGALLLRLPGGSRRAIHAGDVMLGEG